MKFNPIKICVLAFLPLYFRLCFFLAQPNEKAVKITTQRADIVDSEGNLLASTIPTWSTYIVPESILDASKTAKQIAETLDLKEEIILKKIEGKARKFAWIARHITPWQKKAIIRLGLSGVHVTKDMKRFYPQGSLFSHIVGKVDIDNKGISGVESSFNKRLINDKKPLQLSLSSVIQTILKEKLESAQEKFSAIASNGIIVCAKTGKILASFSKTKDSDLNPHKNYDPNNSGFINRNTHSTFEMGSILKIINIAMLLETKTANLESTVFAGSPWYVSRRPITDFSPKNRDLTLQEAFLYSSNIANAKFAKFAGAEKQTNFFKKCGFLECINMDGMKSVSSIRPKKWREINTVTAAYGYGIAITPMHFIKALLRVISGKEKDIHILNYPPKKFEKRIFSSKTVNIMRCLLEKSVSHGQSQRAYVKGYRIGGKTGTANRRIGNRYIERNNMCSFVFAFPINDPKIIGIISLDNPKATKETFGFVVSGFITAPVVAELIEKIGPILGEKKQEISNNENTLA